MAVMRRALLGGIAIAAFALTAAPAGAANVTVNCAELPEALKNASAGEVITLNQLCTGPFPYKLPEAPVTLAGTPGAGFNGGSATQLEGKTASSTIEGLIFENANNPVANSGGGLSINGPGSPAAVTLAKDSFVNDAASASEGGGARINTSTAVVTVTDSTFTGDSAKATGGGLAIFAATANLTGDTFSADSAGPDGQGGGLFVVAGASTLSGSQFTNDTATDVGGGAEIKIQAASGLGLTLTGDIFSHNGLADPSATSKDVRGYLGGGLAVFAEGLEPTAVVQRDNTFDSNSVSFKAAPISAMGAGESVSRVALQSTADRFTNNALQPPSEAKNPKVEPVFGWGAGLSITQCGDGIAESPAPTVLSTLSDAVVAGNTLISGPSANGAGIYVGFACATAYTALQLNDSTVAGNVVSGASGPVAGISGGPRDVLTLANTIVAGDSGGAELGGFGSLAGVTAAFSDVCSGSAPFAGAGNICADPRLAGPGPGSSDVRETGASPTIEAGSNALIPSGLTTDAFGNARIAGPTGCAGNPAAVVDIGAAEFTHPAPPCVPILLHAALAPNLSSLSQTAKTWREGKQLARLSSSKGKGKKKVPIGTTFSFKLDQPARVTFTFTRTARGRRVGKRCVAQTHKNKRKHRCSRTLIAGALGFSAHAGMSKVRFQGLISKHSKLKPGSYKLLVTASAAGKRSRTGTLRFTIAR
jgi:hypothetical protein